MNLPNALMPGKDYLGRVWRKLRRCCCWCWVVLSSVRGKRNFLLVIETHAGIMAHCQEVTHNQENIFDLQWMEVPDMALKVLEALSRNMVFHPRRLRDEQDECTELIVDLTQEWEYH